MKYCRISMQNTQRNKTSWFHHHLVHVWNEKHLCVLLFSFSLRWSVFQSRDDCSDPSSTDLELFRYRKFRSTIGLLSHRSSQRGTKAVFHQIIYFWKAFPVTLKSRKNAKELVRKLAQQMLLPTSPSPTFLRAFMELATWEFGSSSSLRFE